MRFSRRVFIGLLQSHLLLKVDLLISRVRKCDSGHGAVLYFHHGRYNSNIVSPDLQGAPLCRFFDDWKDSLGLGLEIPMVNTLHIDNMM